MADDFSQRYGDLLQGAYDCVDRIVLNAYYSLAHSAGGFREWWGRLNNGAEDNLDNAHLMRMAGRFSRRVHGFARAHGIPIIDCGRGERKHRIAEEYLATHAVKRGLFLILVGRAMAPVWEVQRSASGVIQNLEKKRPYINHYSFHILDPEWGHITIKMAGHPPFWRSGHPQRPRVRRLPGPQASPQLYQGGQRLHTAHRHRTLGEDRRYLDPGRDNRAADPSVRAVDLFRVFMLRAGHR